MKARKIIANVFVGLANAHLLLAIVAGTVIGYVCGIVGLLGVFGQILLNLKEGK